MLVTLNQHKNTKSVLTRHLPGDGAGPHRLEQWAGPPWSGRSPGPGEAAALFLRPRLGTSSASLSPACFPLGASRQPEEDSHAQPNQDDCRRRAVTAALAAGSTVAVAAATGGKPGAPAKTTSASEKPGHDAIVAAVARELHVSTARVSAALQPLFAAGHADTSSPAFAAAARALGVSTGQLQTALAHAKQSLAAGPYAKRSPDGAKTAPAGSKAAEERPGHDAMVAAVAAELHVSTARVSAALQPLFAAGHADTSSPAFAAAARALGVSTNQLDTALMHAKQSLAQSS